MELLPWYVNGTLGAQERERVEAHVRDCVPCRLALREQRELQATVREHPTLRVSAERDFDRLMRKIDGSPAAGPSRESAWSARGFAMAASVLLAFGALGATVYFASNLREPVGEFETLTSAASERGVRIDVIFADGVTESAMRDLIRTVGGSLVGGPSDAGRYTIELPGSVAAEELDTVLAELSADARVRFAGRSYIDPARPEGGP